MSEYGTFRVQMFAGAAELAEVRVVELQLIGSTTVETSKAQLCERFPQLRSLVRSAAGLWIVDLQRLKQSCSLGKKSH
ncbi:MAG: hypothetical protein U0892_02200 [Pirellulales bacterium]